MSELSVLGIDAAWTEHEPSGVALLKRESGGWRLVALESSYERFLALSLGEEAAGPRPTGSKPDVGALVAACRRLTGEAPDLVSVDMPLSIRKIERRRPCDNEISSEYGGRKCGTHSPSAERPGKVSDGLRSDFAALGYRLWTKPDEAKFALPGLIEVYPHPALIELTGASERLRYKVGKSAGYWPGTPIAERRGKVLAEWRRILDALSVQVMGLDAILSDIPAQGPMSALKSWEDKIDAVVCGWVGACVLEGRARAFGDAQAAIWVPAPSGG